MRAIRMTSIGRAMGPSQMASRSQTRSISEPKTPYAVACIAVTLLLSACASKPEATARTGAVCEALRPAMPVLFHGKADTPDTIARIKAANARFQAACQ